MMVQIFVGVVFYVLASVVFKLASFRYLLSVIKGFLRK